MTKRRVTVRRRRSHQTGGDLNSDLFQAIRDGNLDSVKSLVAQGVDINHQDKYGLTPLHNAASTNLEIVKYLVEKGANINQQDNYRLTPLHNAIYSGNLEIVTYLVEKVADINHPDEMGLTLLDYAVNFNKKPIAKFLMDKGAKSQYAEKLDELFYELNGLQEFIDENNTKSVSEQIPEAKIREEFEKTLKNKCGLDSVCPVTHYKNSALIEIKRCVYLENVCFSFYAFSYKDQLLKNPLTRTEWEDKIKTAIDRIRQYSKYLQIEMYHLDENKMTKSETDGGTSRRRTTRRYRGKTSRRTRSARRRIR